MNISYNIPAQVEHKVDMLGYNPTACYTIIDINAYLVEFFLWYQRNVKKQRYIE